MADNIVKYGFRYFGGADNLPKPLEKIVASAAEFDVTNGIQNAVLQAGDVVALVNDGSVTMCAGGETTPGLPYGVVVGGIKYYDSSIGQAGQMRIANNLPSAITWGTNRERASRVLVVPFLPGQLWEVDVDDATTATTFAAYEAFEGENVTFINSGAASSTPAWIRPKIDISTHATTASLFFRIEKVSPTRDNVDFSGANVKLLVSINPYAAATPSAATPTRATGV